MENKNYKNGRKLYIITCILLGIGFICFLLYHSFNLHFSGHLSTCFMNAFLHIYCPGCGGTRAIDYLLHGQILKSFICHPLVVYLLLLFLSYFLPATYTYVIKRNGRKYYRFRPFTLYVMLGIILGFFFLRNALMIFLHYDFLGDCLKYWI